jgi:glutamate-1-semialdehyde 2,1-aminomutase
LSHTGRANGALVIADEVLTGLRLHPGITGHRLGLEPDLATMGKAIGSGIPVGAVLGTDEAFQPITTGRLKRFGTYNGSPMVTAVVTATMKHLAGADYAGLMETGRQLRLKIVNAFANAGIAVSTSGLDSAFTIWFCPERPRTYAEAVKLVDPARTTRLHLALRRRGVMTMPYPWGRLFLSFAHGPQEFDKTIAAVAEFAHELASNQPSSRSSA